MPRQTLLSWGRVLQFDSDFLDIDDRFACLPELPAGASSLLPYGNGRSYGDSCLNRGGLLLRTHRLDRFIRFDPVSGVLACEAGVLLAEILQLAIPRRWFLPVAPGTQYVTVGGAIANDVHGKNHHVAGTFGRHVNGFELLRSDGSRRHCSRDKNPEWFSATIGGLGLTGLITWAELQLKPIDTPWIDSETIRFGSLEEFFALCAESDKNWEYTVAWIDCVGRPNRLGRGLFTRGNHAGESKGAVWHSARRMGLPFVPPFSLVNGLSLRMFNAFYYRKQLTKRLCLFQHCERFFFPLDGIEHWNRMYGPKGFYQYQCVVPTDGDREVLIRLLGEISRSGLGSFLAILKLFGVSTSPGILSFPRAGVTLALDFPNRGERLEQLFLRLDAVVGEAGGRLYPAKDGRMSGEMFRTGYPNWKTFSQFVDPAFSSSFWRRVMEGA
jgi:FAD/FMN-containing dehydrogenase